MRVCSASSGSADYVPGNAHPLSDFSDLLSRGEGKTNFGNLLFGQHGIPVFTSEIPWRVNMTATTDGVSDIFNLPTGPQMIWIDAFGVIARMKNKQSILDRSFGFNVGQSMRKLFILISKISGTYHPVPLVVGLAKPFPASIWAGLVNAVPKSLIKHKERIGLSHARVNR